MSTKYEKCIDLTNMCEQIITNKFYNIINNNNII